MTKHVFFTGLGLFFLALILRLPYLNSFMTIDEVKWLEGAAQFTLALHNLDFAKTYWHFHPGITLTWGETIILYGLYLASPAADLNAFIEAQLTDLASLVGPMRLSGVVLTSLAILILYCLARPLLGDRSALLGTGLLAAAPFFVAHSRIINGDAGAAILMMLSFLAFTLLWRKQDWRLAALSGFMAGLALLTKLPAPILVPWLLLLTLFGYLQERNWKLWLNMIVITGLATLLTFVLLWPAMWSAPWQTLSLMAQDAFEVGEVGSGHETFFFGQISNDPGWLFYPYVILFRLSPLTLIGLLGLFVWLWLNRRGLKDVSGIGLVLLSLVLYIIYLYIFASLSPKKLDRYLMSVLPALTLLAGFGLNTLFEVTTRGLSRFQLINRRQSAFQTVLVLGAIGLQALLVINHYPYVLTYYNPLLGGYARAVEQIPVGWGEGLEQAADWINAQSDADTARVSPWYSDIVRPYLNSETLSFSSNGRGQLAADYVIFYVNQRQREKPNPALVSFFTEQDPAFVLDHAGTPYVWVYRAPGMDVQASGSPRIEGRARLLGYSWSQGPPFQAGQMIELTLFLLSEGDLPQNEIFSVTLEDEAGQQWGQWQGAAQSDWATEDLITWSGQLHLDADLAAETYRLVIQLIDKNINSEVTRFPLDEDDFPVEDN